MEREEKEGFTLQKEAFPLAQSRAGHRETWAFCCPEEKREVIIFIPLLNYELPLQREEKESPQLIHFTSVLAPDFSSFCLFSSLN